MSNYRSHGKLLITGEYAVLDGALSLAVPTKMGQSMVVRPSEEKGLRWNSLDVHENSWFSTFIDLEGLLKGVTPEFRDDISSRLFTLLVEARRLNPEFLGDFPGFRVTTQLEFPRNWGLGSSSTLINNLAQWARVDAYELQARTFGGSGYDLACAQHGYPLLYQLIDGLPRVDPVTFHPPFKDQLFFVFLNRKQDSRKGIEAYRERGLPDGGFLSAISDITTNLVKAKSLIAFENLLSLHEDLVAARLEVPTIRETLFSDYPGAIKSLGAWGGDFILATGSPGSMRYFKERGFTTILSFPEMVV